MNTNHPNQLHLRIKKFCIPLSVLLLGSVIAIWQLCRNELAPASTGSIMLGIAVFSIILCTGVVLLLNQVLLRKDRQLLHLQRELDTEIAVRTTAETERKRKETWLYTIQNSIKTGIIIIDQSTRRIVDANPAACAMINCTRDDLLGNLCHDHICPSLKDHCPVLDLHQSVDNAERTLLTRDGTEIPILKTAVPVTIGAHDYLLESFVDISALKTAEHTLRRNQVLLNVMQHLARIGAWEWDPLQNIITWTDEIYGMLEMPFSHKPTPASTLALIAPEDRSRIRKTLLHVLRTGESIDCECSAITHKDQRIHMRMIAQPERVNGKVTLIQGIFQDITPRKIAEEQLQLSQQAANDGLWDLQIDTMRAHFSPRWYTMLGYTPFELPERYETFASLAHPDDLPRIEALFDSYIHGRTNEYEIQMRMHHKDGHWVWVLSRAKLFFRNEKGFPTRLVGTHVDITRLKEVEAELVHARLAAEQANQAKSAFLATMSHEIRTPMNAVIGMSHLLLNTPLSIQQQEYADTIRTSGDTLLTLINDILDFSKIEAGKLTIEHEPFNVRDCIEAALDLLVKQAMDRNIELAYIMENNVPIEIISDSTRLRQILINLINNAIKFTESGEVVVHIGVEEDTDDSCKLQFCVRDTGIGIPASRIPHLFDSFTQADTSTTRKYGGSGLGLTICQRLTALMGGSIRVESTEGEGSSFYFSIAAKKRPGKVNIYLREKNPTLFGRHMLIVDDNKTNRQILHSQAESWGMIPVDASNAQEALAHLNDVPPFDLAIIDYNMPEIDGSTLAQQIHDRFDKDTLPLIMLSSLDEKKDPSLFSAYLNKPIKPAQLYDVMLNVLGKRHAPTRTPSKSHAIDNTFAMRHPLRILLAEDNIINQKVAIHILRNMGYTDVICANNGIEVLRAVEKQPFDVILMDVQMPEMDGLEATKELRANGCDSFIVALTAGALQGDRDFALAAGMDHYLPKPIRIEKLTEVLTTAFNN